MTEVTRLLRQVREGDRAALEELMPLVYAELRRMAGAFMRRQPPGHTLQPTALVNEAFIKLFQDTRPAVADRAHLLALMSRVMRQILVDHARARVAAKRGGGEQKVPWDTRIEVGDETAAEHTGRLIYRSDLRKQQHVDRGFGRPRLRPGRCRRSPGPRQLATRREARLSIEDETRAPQHALFRFERAPVS